MMLYQDAIYGSQDIREPVLLALMESAAMQRLHGVSQHGITALMGITAPFSRFEHSVGVMLLVRRLGASLEEQIAALLHDVSHTAFSHVIDYVFDDHDRQSYHERGKQAFVAASDIPGILDHHGYDWMAFMDETKFGLLEQEAPALCADRVDYFLRDLEFFRLADSSQISRVLDGLDVERGRIIVDERPLARWMAYTYIDVDRLSWSNPREVGLYQLTAEAIKAAMQQGALGETDLWATDSQLWASLKATKLPEVTKWLALISPGTRFVVDKQQASFRISSKIRSIDPMVSEGVVRGTLSSMDSVFCAYRQAYHSQKQGAVSLRILAL